jgi:phosphoglycolate phosphatase
VRSLGLILYDLDGTLIDSRADLAAAVNRVRGTYGLEPLSLETVVGFVGDGQRKLIERTMADVVAPIEERQARLREDYAAHLLDATRLYPGVAETLAALHAAGWLQAVVTNKPVEATLPILEGLGVKPWFNAVVGAERNLPLKPDPAVVEIAIARVAWDRVGPIWMVGDHHTDLEVGRRAGLLRCYCRYGYGNPAAETWDLAVDRIADFARHLGVPLRISRRPVAWPGR